MKKKLCVCDELRSMRPMEDERLNLNFEIAVYMHAKERYRASNTGKVLEKLYDARMYQCMGLRFPMNYCLVVTWIQ